MSDLPKAILDDLCALATQRTLGAIVSVAQLANANKDRVAIVSAAAACAFGFLARDLQERIAESTGKTPPMEDAFKAAIDVIGEIACEHADYILRQPKASDHQR